MAYKPLHHTKRCHLLEDISRTVWQKIIRAHRVKTNLKEVGITAEIIVEILNFNIDEIGNFEIYAKPGWNEEVYGSDIDFFVETYPGKFRWFALQAKLLKKNGRYDTLRDGRDSWQWEKLALLEGSSGCKAFYLLYNGRDGFEQMMTDCKGTHFADQFGCSLVEPKIISKLAMKKSPSGTYINPTFEDIHPIHAAPWRMLTCCKPNSEDVAFYTALQVLGSDTSFKLIDDLEDGRGVNEPVAPANENPNNPISAIAESAKWNPGLRFVVRQTQSL